MQVWSYYINIYQCRDCPTTFVRSSNNKFQQYLSSWLNMWIARQYTQCIQFMLTSLKQKSALTGKFLWSLKYSTETNTKHSKTNRLKTACLNFVSIHFCSVHASSDLSEKGHSCYKWGRIKTYYLKICTNNCLTRSTAAEEYKLQSFYINRGSNLILCTVLKWVASLNTCSFFLHIMLLIVLGCTTANCVWISLVTSI
jgi:hypothetical protein